jgi:hypothetical protein
VKRAKRSWLLPLLWSELKPLRLRYNPKAIGVAWVPVGFQLKSRKPHPHFQCINVIHAAKVIIGAGSSERSRANVRRSNPARLAGGSEGKPNMGVSLATHDSARNRVDAGADRNVALDNLATKPLSEKQVHIEHVFRCSIGKNSVGANDVSGFDWWFSAPQRIG